MVQADGSLKIRGKTVHLFGIWIPPTNRICRTTFDPPLCGSRAVTALELKIQSFVFCEPVSRNRDRSVNALCAIRCTVGSGRCREDLSTWMLQQGWAIATPDAPFQFHALERIARTRGLGVWGFQVDSITRR